MLKVLYVSPNGYLGGAERFVLTAVIGHRIEKNIDASILFFSDGEACKEARQDGINCYILKTSFRLRTPWKLFLALREIRKIVIQNKPDILHLTMPYSHIVLSLATMGLGIKKVWFQHGPVGGRLDKIANLFPVDMIWFNSNYLKSLHHQTWPPTRVKIQESVISLGVKSKTTEHKLFLNSSYELGSAGRICSGKGFDTIIIALGELKKERLLKPYRFLIAGAAKSDQDKVYAKELLDLVKLYHMEAEIKFLEHVENMEGFYQKLDVFVHSSIFPEPFGLVVAEAMIYGCLVLGSNSGGVSDFLKNETTGLTFAAASKDAIKELKKLFTRILSIEDDSNIDLYRELAQRGREFVEINYSIDRMIGQIESLYFLLEKD